MSRLFVLFLLLVGFTTVSGSHGNKKDYKGKKHPYYDESENVDFTWEQAEGYLECEEFLDRPDFDEETRKKLADSFDERGYFRKQPKPRALEKSCSDWECAPIVNSTSPGCGFKTRPLKRGNWITTRIDLPDSPQRVATIDSDKMPGYRAAYMRLHGYRSGDKNSLKQPVGMALPVMKKWYLDDDYKIINATMSFYVPSPFQEDPPASLDEDVRVEQWDEVITYSRTWGGSRHDAEFWPNSGDQFDKLGAALQKQNIKWYSHLRMTGAYVGRRELIFVDKDITVTEISKISDVTEDDDETVM